MESQLRAFVVVGGGGLLVCSSFNIVERRCVADNLIATGRSICVWTVLVFRQQIGTLTGEQQ